MDDTNTRGTRMLWIMMVCVLTLLAVVAYHAQLMRAWDVTYWWFLHAIGADNPSGPEYGAWSGFLSDLGEVALIGAVVEGAHQHNCHVRGCWRLGLHSYDMDGQHVKLCRKHHPRMDTVTHQEVVDHAEATSPPEQDAAQ